MILIVVLRKLRSPKSFKQTRPSVTFQPDRHIVEKAEQLQHLLDHDAQNKVAICRSIRELAGFLPRGLTDSKQYMPVFLRAYAEVMQWTSVPPHGAFMLTGAFGHVRMLTAQQWTSLRSHLKQLDDLKPNAVAA